MRPGSSRRSIRVRHGASAGVHPAGTASGPGSRFATHAEMEEFLRSLSPEEIERYRENAREFMASDAYRPFTKQTFAETLVRAVEEDLGIAA